MEKLTPNSDALAALRRLIATLGGTPLPVPSGLAPCDDCNQDGPTYPYGQLQVCARDWHRRDTCRQLAIKHEL